MSQRQTSIPLIQQRGAALVVSLILLLIMTIVGVAAMNGARLEVSVAGLRLDEEVALRRAERVVTMIETYIDTTPFTLFSEGDGFYLPEAKLNVNVSSTDWTDIAKLDSSKNAALQEHEELVIEYLGVMTLFGDSENVGGDQPIPGSKVKGFRITGRSGSDGKAVRIVETVFLKPYNALDPGA